MEISFDTPEENLAFTRAEEFGFVLLSDIARSAGAAYEAVQDDTEHSPGRPRRCTYVIDPRGVISGAFEVSDIDGHAEAVLATITAAAAG